ncbi:hypothetical protein QFC24_003978 [Naganishia onofrii]|uniref:Uncharacterized protein n=1 Tax=Naganishia onofrii TaxID=1851511 RepID=A0ACC2XHR5_9TREE|nr:hypothetical protein QFC24_003978 [Naganishia onofrii]
MHQMAIEMDAEEDRKASGLHPVESDWTVYLFGANPALEDEEMPFELTPCESDLSLAIFGNEAAAHVVEAPSRTVAAIFNKRNNELEALGIPLSESDKDIQMRINRNETPFLSASDEMFFEPGRLPFEYRLAVWEEDGEMPMLMDEQMLMEDKPLVNDRPFGLHSLDSNMSCKFAAMQDVTFTDMEMLTDEPVPKLCARAIKPQSPVRHRQNTPAHATQSGLPTTELRQPVTTQSAIPIRRRLAIPTSTPSGITSSHPARQHHHIASNAHSRPDYDNIRRNGATSMKSNVGGK